MADVESLRDMVLCLRKSELHSLLNFSNCYRAGRKLDLLLMALSLVDHSTPLHIQLKIIELYGSRFVHQFPLIKSDPGKSLSDYGMDQSNLHYPLDSMRSGSYLNSSISTHLSSTPTAAAQPNIKFNVLPFYDVLAELLPPSSLVPAEPSVSQTSYFVFCLTPYQAQDIAVSSAGGSASGYNLEIQLRFCSLDTTQSQDDFFPPNIVIRVNDMTATLPSLLPPKKPGAEPRRLSQPIDITPLCSTLSSLTNHIAVSWTYATGRCYCLAVNLVKKVSADVLLQRLKNNAVRHPDDTWALIQEKLNIDSDGDVVATSLRVSLLCPIGKTRMTYACRAHTCAHLQCFDAAVYLQMNERKPTWTCPVCDEPATFASLTLDGLFANIIHREPDGDEIEFSAENGWRVIGRAKGGEAEPAGGGGGPTKVNLSKSSEEPMISSSSVAVAPSSDAVIDLTETSDEEEGGEAEERGGNNTPACRTSPLAAVSTCQDKPWGAHNCATPTLPVVSFGTPPLPTTMSPATLRNWAGVTGGRASDLSTPDPNTLMSDYSGGQTYHSLMFPKPPSAHSSQSNHGADLSSLAGYHASLTNHGSAHSSRHSPYTTSLSTRHSPHVSRQSSAAHQSSRHSARHSTHHSALHSPHHSSRYTSHPSLLVAPPSSRHSVHRASHSPHRNKSPAMAPSGLAFDPYSLPLHPGVSGLSSFLGFPSFSPYASYPLAAYSGSLVSASIGASALGDELYSASDSFADYLAGLEQLQPTDLTVGGAGGRGGEGQGSRLAEPQYAFPLHLAASAAASRRESRDEDRSFFC